MEGSCDYQRELHSEIKVPLHLTSLIQELPSIYQMLPGICASLVSLGHYTVTHIKSKPFPDIEQGLSRFLLVPGFLEVWYNSQGRGLVGRQSKEAYNNILKLLKKQ